MNSKYQSKFSIKKFLAVVVWRDAATEGNGFFDPGEFTGLSEQHTAGWFVSIDKEKITLALDYSPQINLWREIIHIPVVNIVWWKKMKVK